MDMKAVGQRIKAAREAKGYTQEEVAAIVDSGAAHISVIERGLKVPKLDTFVAIANALEVSADVLLQDVLDGAVVGMSGELSKLMKDVPSSEQKRIIRAVKVLIEE